MVNDVAWSQLHRTVKLRRRLQEVNLADMVDFINHPPLPQESRARDVQSLWSVVRKSLQHVSASLKFDNTNVSLHIQDNTVESTLSSTLTLSTLCLRSEPPAGPSECPRPRANLCHNFERPIEQPLDYNRGIHIFSGLPFCPSGTIKSATNPKCGKKSTTYS